MNTFDNIDVFRMTYGVTRNLYFYVKKIEKNKNVDILFKFEPKSHVLHVKIEAKDGRMAFKPIDYMYLSDDRRVISVIDTLIFRMGE